MAADTGTMARWATTHGVARLGIGAAARRGDPQATFLVDRRFRADPYPYYESVRARGPIVRTRLMWTTATHEVASAVLRSDAFGVGVNRGRNLPGPLARINEFGQRTRPIGPVDPPSMLVTDPPDHTRYRRLVSKVFTARAIEALRPRIEARSAELLDGLEAAADGGRADLVRHYCSLLPVTVISEVLGVPVAMRERFLAWGAAAAPTLDLGLGWRTYARTEAAIKESNAWMRGHFARLREEPGEDLLSKLVQQQADGDGLTDDELLATAGLLLAAGFETTVNLLGTGAALLVRHPDQLELLRADPALWRNAAEEVLRYDSPVQTTARLCQREIEIAGRRIEPGHVVATMLAGANRDPAAFADPDRFDVTRENARDHLALSAGVHYCLGAALARLEGEIGLRALFDRFPDLALDGEPHRRPTRVLRGYDALPVRLGARTPSARSAVPAP